MKKKYSVPSKDKKDWINFTKEIGNIRPKEEDLFEGNQQLNKVQKIDLHGYSLNEANEAVKKFIIKSFDQNCKKLLIITGKGLRSKSYSNPYTSESLNVLKNAVPEYIKNDEHLNSMVQKITQADYRHGGQCAINIFLKNNKKFIR